MLTHYPRQVSNRFMANFLGNKKKLQYSPCSLSIDLTTICNMDCSFCSTANYREIIKKRNLSFGKVKKLLDKYNKATWVSFCGEGEPFLNPDLFKMVNYAHDLKMGVLVTTNGTLLEERMQELLASNVKTLEISFKATCEKEYELFTGRKEKEFNLIIDTIKKLSEFNNRPKLIGSYVCDKRRIYDIPKIFEIASKCGVDEVLFHSFIPDAESKNESHCLFEDDRDTVTEILNTCKEKFHKLIVHGPNLCSQSPEHRSCFMPFKSMKISVDGGVSGCTKAIDPNINNGNAFNENDVYNNEHFIKLRSQFIDNDIPLRYECMFCHKRI